MSDDTFQYIVIEYHELNLNVREWWKYISELLRSFLFLQILLISLMFLGGGLIEVDGMHVQIRSVHDAILDRSLIIIPLIFIGGAGSFGAFVQNWRLFKNATNFVRRAAYLETLHGFVADIRPHSLGQTSPPNTYMSNNLYGRFDYLRALLTFNYVAFFFLWAFFSYKIYSGH